MKQYIFVCPQVYTRRGVHKSRATKFCTLAPNILGKILAIFLLNKEKLYHCICNKQKALDMRFTGHYKIVGSQHRTSYI
jgi:hypothetical protein